MFTKGRNFASVCETGIKKTGSRSRVCNEVNIGIPLHWSGCFFLLIQCSYGITVYILSLKYGFWCASLFEQQSLNTMSSKIDQ